MKAVRFDFKKNSVFLWEPTASDTPLSEKGLRRSPRIQKKLDGYKNKPKDNVGIPSNGEMTMASKTQQGKGYFSFPGPVKFPSLTNLEKCKEYPKIPTPILQEVAIRMCSVPRKEATLELLEAPTRSSGRKGGSSVNDTQADGNDESA